jgi:hypothetical protein
MPSFDEQKEDVEMSKPGLLRDESKFKENDPAKKGLRSNIVDGACILLNIASTVVLVFLNKWYVVLQDAMDSDLGILSNSC